MSQQQDDSTDIKRWTARRKESLVLEILKGQTTSAEAARQHSLTVAEVEQWREDFLSQGTEVLRAHPPDAEAEQQAEKKGLLAKIGDLTMQMEVYKIACDIQGKPYPDVNS